MTTLADWQAEVRTSLEDYGSTVTDQFTGDGTTVLLQTSNHPIKTTSEIVTVGGALQATPANYTINYDNGEVKFVVAPTTGVTVLVQYVKVIWRDERLTSAINAGVRRLYPLLYKVGLCYVKLRPEVYEYDLTSTTDVPPSSSFGDQVIPSSYTNTVAITDLQKAQSRIHFGDYRPFGANQIYTPYEFFRRNSVSMLALDMDPGPADALRLTYTSPFTPLVLITDVTDVPDEFFMMPVWYALSVLMEKKEARRARSDTLATMQNANATPPGTQAQTAEDYLARYHDTLQQNAMRPMRISARRQLRAWQYYERGSI